MQEITHVPVYRANSNNRNSKEAVFYVKKLPTVHRKLETPMITVSSVAEEGLEPPTPGL